MSEKNFIGNQIEVMRATDEWQRAGAYSVRIEGMNRQHHISLREEFDEHDGPGTRYIVLLDDGYPVATCRFFVPDPAGGKTDTAHMYQGFSGLVMLGRVVVLPDYRGAGLGERVMREAESWIRELGYKHIGVDSRVEVVGFYEKLGFRMIDPQDVISGPFVCKCMIKSLSD